MLAWRLSREDCLPFGALQRHRAAVRAEAGLSRIALNKPNIITPRTLRGFRDYLPEAMIPREQLIETARGVYRSYGFSPIDTPALEYLDILLGKGGEETDKQLYKFQDQGGRWVGMRFDLTVPLARFAAQHVNELGIPLKRYHIATVWRGEKAQRGRYREFMQCDFDTIGSRSIGADIETVLVIYDLFRALGFERFAIRLNNRTVLTGLLEQLDLADKSTAVLRALDKLAKIGPEHVADEIVRNAETTPQQAREVLKLATIGGSNDEVLSQLESLIRNSETGRDGVARLSQLVAGARAAGLPNQALHLDVSIARGLDYYTGTVFETFLTDLPEIGSVCSGGRYDNLAELYTKQELPGIGASLGLDRLLAAMEELGMIDRVSTAAPVFVPFFDKDRLHDYLKLAAAIRGAGIGVEVFPEPKRLGQQLKYADRRGFRVALIAGEDEFQKGVCQVKDLTIGSKQDVPLENNGQTVIKTLQRILKS